MVGVVVAAVFSTRVKQVVHPTTHPINPPYKFISIIQPIHPPTLLFTHQYTHPLIHPPINTHPPHPPIHPSIHPPSYSPTHPPINTPTHPFTLPNRPVGASDLSPPQHLPQPWPHQSPPAAPANSNSPPPNTRHVTYHTPGVSIHMSTHSVNSPCQHTLSTHPVFTPVNTPNNKPSSLNTL